MATTLNAGDLRPGHVELWARTITEATFTADGRMRVTYQDGGTRVYNLDDGVHLIDDEVQLPPAAAAPVAIDRAL